MSHHGSPRRPEEAQNELNPEMKHQSNGDHLKDNGRRSRSGSERSFRSNDRPERNVRRSRSPRSNSRDARPRPPAENTQIYVAGIGSSVSQEDLREAFLKFGPIVSIALKRRYAFIDFETFKDAQAAIEEMNGKSLRGYELCVETPRKLNTPKSSRINQYYLGTIAG